MNTAPTVAILCASLCGAVVLGRRVRHHLPEHHRTEETKDAVKLAMGLTATMSALLLGLLVSSAKGSYDNMRSQVIQMSAKITLLDRVLRLYGPEAAPLRTTLHSVAAPAMLRMWSTNDLLASDIHAGDAIYAAMHSLSPQNDTQRALRDQALNLAAELAQIRTLLHAQSVASISRPLLVVVTSWLTLIFFAFSLFSPSNATATTALLASALSVAGAILLIMEFDRPFTGLIRISDEPIANALNLIKE